MADNPFKLSQHAVAPSSDGASPVSGGSGIGDLRRRYAFGSRVSELAIDQTPFFRFLSMAAKKPTDDPEFKSLEQRNSWHKRYAYVQSIDQDATSSTTLTVDANYSGAHATTNILTVANHAQDGVFAIQMATDFKSEGNVQSVLGQTATVIGSAGTKPAWMIPGQLIRIPVDVVTSVSVATKIRDDYMVCAVQSIGTLATLTQSIGVLVKVVRPVAVTGTERCAFKGSTFADSVWTITAAAGESNKVYATGSAHAEGSTFPDTWKDQPYVDVYGLCQIFKTTCQMTNTARATQLKLVADEWGRVWKQKLMEHKYDMEQAFLFNRKHQDGTTRYTQGIIDYVLQSGNIFALNTATKTQDSFLDDMSNFLDPRYNNGNATVFFANTDIYNWLHKLSGYFSNNVGIIGTGGQTPVTDGTSLGRADMAITGKKKVFGLNITTISTPYGDMNVTRNIHLDGGQAGAKMIGVNMKHVAYRPLVGNGVNRDTSIHVGVQSLENTGVDRRIDLIQTEAGLECLMPEAHAVWK
jgi:hypothetical protein